MNQITYYLQTPTARAILPILVIILLACIVLKAAKGCIKFLIVAILLVGLVVYVGPIVFG